MGLHIYDNLYTSEIVLNIFKLRYHILAFFTHWVVENKCIYYFVPYI